MRSEGFSLVELMVVVCILAVLSAAFVVGVTPTEAARAEREARRLAALLELAAAEARASGEMLAWSAERSGYSFWRKGDDGEWLRFPDTSPYRRRALEANVTIEGGNVALTPYGLQAPFETTVSGGNTRIIVRSGALGRVSLQRIHAD